MLIAVITVLYCAAGGLAFGLWVMYRRVDALYDLLADEVDRRRHDDKAILELLDLEETRMTLH